MSILVVDDHVELVQLVARSLARDSFRVITANGVAAASGALRDPTVELVVLDLGLPDGSGIELCRQLRRDNRHLPILVLTANNAVSSRVECLEAGADDYLGKPFAVAELRARVRALLRRARRPVSPVHTLGEVVLDFSARRATVCGRLAPITAKEWAILDTLAAAAGAVVKREELLDRVWPGDDEDRAASLEVLISRIRRKLDKDVVRTVRNQGYALAQPETLALR